MARADEPDDPVVPPLAVGDRSRGRPRAHRIRVLEAPRKQYEEKQNSDPLFPWPTTPASSNPSSLPSQPQCSNPSPSRKLMSPPSCRTKCEAVLAGLLWPSNGSSSRPKQQHLATPRRRDH